MKKARIAALFCAIILTISLLPSTKAAESKEKIIDLGDGFYVVEAIEYTPSSRSGDTAQGTKTFRLYQDSTLIGVTVLVGVFDISGTTAKAISGSISGTGYNGWSYYSGYVTCSGNTVNGTASYRRSSDGLTKTHYGSISCSSNGTIS